jgi:hypothetical protein
MKARSMRLFTQLAKKVACPPPFQAGTAVHSENRIFVSGLPGHDDPSDSGPHRGSISPGAFRAWSRENIRAERISAFFANAEESINA